MKYTALIMLATLSGCASTYNEPVTAQRPIPVYDQEDVEYAVTNRAVPEQREAAAPQRSFLTTGIMGYNLYRNISSLNGDMIRSELKAREDAMISNPSELFNPLY